MEYLPLFLEVRNRAVLLVGGGGVALRKLRLLRAAQAQVTVVAPALHAEVSALVRQGAIKHIAAVFSAAHLHEQRLVIAATNDHAVNRIIAAEAEARGIWANVVDDAELSSCIVPAIVDRSPLIVAVSSGGTAPMLARWARAKIELALDESLGRLAKFCARWRERIVGQVSAGERREFYTALLTGPIADLVRQQREPQAEEALERALASRQQPTGPTTKLTVTGHVTLVGAGPGDPGLLTLNALRALQEADVIVHDRLVSAEVLALARRDATLVDVGKEGGGVSVSQQRTHQLMVAYAHAGQRVVRLKGGDPLVFGRGGEELEVLRAANIPFSVVPGISAAAGAAAYAGIPLTHRDYAQGLRYVTAHLRDGAMAPNWAEWANTNDTLVVYMGLAQLPILRRELLRHGRAEQTPVALIENASRVTQRIAVGVLSQVDTLAASQQFKSPTLLIIGEVARFANSLHWFGAPPLALADPPRGAERAA